MQGAENLRDAKSIVLCMRELHDHAFLGPYDKDIGPNDKDKTGEKLAKGHYCFSLIFEAVCG